MKRVWIYLMVSIAFILVGSLVVLGALCMVNFEWNALSTNPLISETCEVAEPFSSIAVGLRCSDVTIQRAEDGVCRVDYAHQKSTTVHIAVKDGTLTIDETDHRRWMDYIGVFSMTPSATVYVPDDTYDRLQIIVSTGDITVPPSLTFNDTLLQTSTGHIECEASVVGDMELIATTGKIEAANAAPHSLKIDCHTGDVELTDLRVGEALHVQTTTGDIYACRVTAKTMDWVSTTGDKILEQVTAIDTFHATANTGDIRLVACDAASMELTATTGDIGGSVVTAKRFETSSSTGKIDVPATDETATGTCVIKTSTGDICLTVGEEAQP